MEHIKSLENSNLSDEQKAKIINEISESFDILLNDKSLLILDIVNIFMKYLKNGDYQFFSESPVQKVIIILPCSPE